MCALHLPPHPPRLRMEHHPLPTHPHRQADIVAIRNHLFEMLTDAIFPPNRKC